MNQRSKLKFVLKRLARDQRGAAMVIVTMFLPVLVGVFSFATDMSYIYYTRNMLQVTAEAAALASTTQLPNKTLTISLAKNYAEQNMPKASNGGGSGVLVDGDVVPGTWTNNCAAGGQN